MRIIEENETEIFIELTEEEAFDGRTILRPNGKRLYVRVEGQTNIAQGKIYAESS